MHTLANDLNPVSVLIMRATVQWPAQHGKALQDQFEQLSEQFLQLREVQLSRFFPPEPKANCIPTNFIWARTIPCPYCEGLVPLSPNWRLAPDGTGVRLKPETGTGAGASGAFARSTSYTPQRSSLLGPSRAALAPVPIPIAGE